MDHKGDNLGKQYSSPPLTVRDMFQDPQWTPETAVVQNPK